MKMKIDVRVTINQMAPDLITFILIYRQKKNVHRMFRVRKIFRSCCLILILYLAFNPIENNLGDESNKKKNAGQK